MESWGKNTVNTGLGGSGCFPGLWAAPGVEISLGCHSTAPKIPMFLARNSSPQVQRGKSSLYGRIVGIFMLERERQRGMCCELFPVITEEYIQFIWLLAFLLRGNKRDFTASLGWALVNPEVVPFPEWTIFSFLGEIPCFTAVEQSSWFDSLHTENPMGYLVLGMAAWKKIKWVNK